MKIKTLQVRLNPDLVETDTEEAAKFLSTVQVDRIESKFREGKENAWSMLVFYRDQQGGNGSAETARSTKPALREILPTLEPQVRKTAEALSVWRADKARKMNVKPFMVLSNDSLLSISTLRPSDRSELESVKGIGKAKAESMGEEILALLNSI